MYFPSGAACLTSGFSRVERRACDIFISSFGFSRWGWIAGVRHGSQGAASIPGCCCVRSTYFLASLTSFGGFSCCARARTFPGRLGSISIVRIVLEAASRGFLDGVLPGVLFNRLDGLSAFLCPVQRRPTL